MALTQFMAGYSQGVVQPETYLENPEMAGILGGALRDYEVERKFGTIARMSKFSLTVRSLVSA